MSETAKPRVLVIGGYGVFGGRITRRLAGRSEIDVIVAGRNLARAEAHCRQHGGMPFKLDIADDLKAVFHELKPTVIVDAAGPFQNYQVARYSVAQAALGSGAHYLDLADDAEFVAGIEVLDQAAKAAGRVALSGCSSVPAISSAAIHALCTDIERIDAVETCIMPGNRAPRGESVVRAILAQVGKPMRVWRAGIWDQTFGWSGVRSIKPDIGGVPSIGRRWTSPIGAPDLQLFPAHFAARTVRFRAGLELGIMHWGLAALAVLVRIGVLPSATILTRPLLWVAERLKPFGTDRGAMTVCLTGRTREGLARRNRWTMVAQAGDGPEIPATPAYLLTLKLCQPNHDLPPGARACLAELSLAEIEDGLAHLAIKTALTTEPFETLFERALRGDFKRLPGALRQLHDVLDTSIFAGTSSVQRGKSVLSRLIGWCMRFPPAATELPVRVEMQRTSAGEIWQRRFGRHTFRSRLTRPKNAPMGEICEKFGPLHCRINLERVAQTLHFPVTAVHLFGFIPLPSILVPISDTREFVDEQGRACFDVSISHPVAGFIVRYTGSLQPVSEANQE